MANKRLELFYGFVVDDLTNQRFPPSFEVRPLGWTDIEYLSHCKAKEIEYWNPKQQLFVVGIPVGKYTIKGDGHKDVLPKLSTIEEAKKKFAESNYADEKLDLYFVSTGL